MNWLAGIFFSWEPKCHNDSSKSLWDLHLVTPAGANCIKLANEKYLFFMFLFFYNCKNVLQNNEISIKIWHNILKTDLTKNITWKNWTENLLEIRNYYILITVAG